MPSTWGAKAAVGKAHWVREMWNTHHQGFLLALSATAFSWLVSSVFPPLLTSILILNVSVPCLALSLACAPQLPSASCLCYNLGSRRHMEEHQSNSLLSPSTGDWCHSDQRNCNCKCNLLSYPQLECPVVLVQHWWSWVSSSRQELEHAWCTSRQHLKIISVLTMC